MRRPYSGLSRRDRELDATAMSARAAEVAPALINEPAAQGSRPQAIGVAIQIEHDGQAAVVSMTLLRTHWNNCGHVVVEMIIADGSHWSAYGTFEIQRDDEGPATLLTECEMPAPLVESGDAKPVADRLMAELVRTGGGWGIDAFSECS